MRSPTEWKLTELLLGGDAASRLTAEYDLLRRALIAHWLRQPLPILDWISRRQPVAALSKACRRAALR